MNSNLQLYPSLEAIRSRLLGEPAAVDLPAEANSDSNDPVGEAAMPAWMRDMVTRAAPQKAAPVPGEPAAGQIWSVAYEGQIAGKAVSGRIPMLLDQQQENGNWSGWLVTADTDYATRADVILDPREIGINPVACMVQTWNRVGALWQANAPYLGQLDAAALNVVRAVAVEPQSRHPPKGLLAHLQQRQVSDGIFALTGDHLGDAQDPRWAYRRLYLELAELLPAISLDNEHDL